MSGNYFPVDCLSAIQYLCVRVISMELIPLAYFIEFLANIAQTLENAVVLFYSEVLLFVQLLSIFRSVVSVLQI